MSSSSVSSSPTTRSRTPPRRSRSSPTSGHSQWTTSTPSSVSTTPVFSPVSSRSARRRRSTGCSRSTGTVSAPNSPPLPPPLHRRLFALLHLSLAATLHSTALHSLVYLFCSLCFCMDHFIDPAPRHCFLLIISFTFLFFRTFMYDGACCTKKTKTGVQPVKRTSACAHVQLLMYTIFVPCRVRDAMNRRKLQLYVDVSYDSYECVLEG